MELEQWQIGDVAVLQNQEARFVQHVGSLFFRDHLQNGCGEGAKVKNLLPNESVEIVERRQATTGKTQQDNS